MRRPRAGRRGLGCPGTLLRPAETEPPPARLTQLLSEPLIPFPGEPGGFWDPDGDGFGSLNDPTGGLYLSHRATSDHIKTGDVLIQLIEHADGSVEEAVATLPYVFETTPALVSYDDGQGNSRELSYPIPGNDFPVEADPTSGDVVVELTFKVASELFFRRGVRGR